MKIKICNKSRQKIFSLKKINLFGKKDKLEDNSKFRLISNVKNKVKF